LFFLRPDGDWKQIILTAGHCIAHNDNGYVEKVEVVRVRVPKLDLWETKPNRARYNENDERLYNFIVNLDQLHIYPDYKDVGNPNTGDDLGLIQLTDEQVIQTLNVNCKFWELEESDFRMDNRHIGTCISFL